MTTNTSELEQKLRTWKGKALTHVVLNEAADEIVRLRSAGDDLAEWVRHHHRSDKCASKLSPGCVCGLDNAIRGWDNIRG